jgi:dATP pyrophosphohydrolase
MLPGTWQAIHGRIEPSEKAFQTALRELREETQLVPLNLYQIDHVNTFYMARDDTVHHCPCFAAEVADDAEPQLNAEHDAWRWLAFDEARESFLWPGQRRALDEIRQEIVGNGPAVAYLRIDLPDVLRP